MKKAIWIITIIIVVAFIGNNYLDRKADRERQKAERLNIEFKIKNDVKNMVSRTGAITSWEKTLSKGERIRLEPILTIELERTWLHTNPILYIGSIKDIKTKDDKSYTVSFERNLYINSDYIFLGAELELNLECSKNDFDVFLQKHPTLFKDYGFNNGVAVIANIDRIYTSDILGEDGERIEVKTGIGRCISILFTGDVQF